MLIYLNYFYLNLSSCLQKETSVNIKLSWIYIYKFIYIFIYINCINSLIYIIYINI